MAREKEYRQQLKYQVASAKKKTLENQAAVELKSNLGMSETEARLLASRISRWLLSRPEVRGPEQIIVEAVDGRDSFVRNGRGAAKKVKLTIFSSEDLDLQLEMGLAAMQLARVLRLIEEAYAQDALLSSFSAVEAGSIKSSSWSVFAQLRLRWLIFADQQTELLERSVMKRQGILNMADLSSVRQFSFG
jgi:hypothetical protein